MKTKNLLFALLSLLIICSACDDSDNQPAENKIPLIKTETRYTYDGQQWGTSTTYEYDRQGRIAKSSNEDLITSYAYEPGKVFVSIYYVDSKETRKDTILLNDKGLQITSGDFTLKYNSEDYLIEEPDFRAMPPAMQTLTILNGNTVKRTHKVWNQYYMVTTTYKFQDGLNTIGNENKGITWCGKQDKNLLSESFEFTKTTGRNYEWLIIYTYELDAKNRVTKKSIRDERGEANILYTYY